MKCPLNPVRNWCFKVSKIEIAREIVFLLNAINFYSFWALKVVQVFNMTQIRYPKQCLKISFCSLKENLAFLKNILKTLICSYFPLQI